MKVNWKQPAGKGMFWVTKILELIHWGGAAFAAALLALSRLAGPRLAQALEQGQPLWGAELKTYGLEVQFLYDGLADLRAVACFALGGIVILSLMAMVFRNIGLILQAAGGKGRFAGKAGVFQPDVVRMVREIGIFCLSVPAVGLAVTNLARLVLGVDRCEASIRLEGFFTGLIVLCLSQVFAQGVRLQQDVDGLI